MKNFKNIGLICLLMFGPIAVQANPCSDTFSGKLWEKAKGIFSSSKSHPVNATDPYGKTVLMRKIDSRMSEQELKNQGYTADYYRGLNDLHEWVAVKKKLQDLGANPYKTHIEYFAKKVEEHIAFATKEMSWFASYEQKTGLAQLKEEAQKAILEKRVTYEWWVNFHIQLSIVLTKQNEGKSIVEIWIKEKIEKIVSHFPEYILFPTPLGLLGFMTFNRAFIEGVYPVGLISRKQRADNLKMNPRMFLFHDMAHAWKHMVFKPVDKHISMRRKMLDIMETLSLEKRTLTELVYFIAIHETENFNWFMQKKSLSGQTRRGLVVDELVRITVDALERKVIPRKMVKDRGIIDVFMEEVYDKTFIP